MKSKLRFVLCYIQTSTGRTGLSCFPPLSSTIKAIEIRTFLRRAKGYARNSMLRPFRRKQKSWRRPAKDEEDQKNSLPLRSFPFFLLLFPFVSPCRFPVPVFFSSGGLTPSAWPLPLSFFSPYLHPSSRSHQHTPVHLHRPLSHPCRSFSASYQYYPLRQIHSYPSELRPMGALV